MIGFTPHARLRSPIRPSYLILLLQANIELTFPTGKHVYHLWLPD